MSDNEYTYDQDSIIVPADPEDGHPVTRREFVARLQDVLEHTIDVLITIREKFEADPNPMIALPDLAMARTKGIDTVGPALMALVMHDQRQQQINEQTRQFASQIPDGL